MDAFNFPQSGWIWLLVLPFDLDPNYLYQIGISITDGSIYTRYYISKTWSGWNKK